jgi:hypothetical protein
MINSKIYFSVVFTIVCVFSLDAQKPKPLNYKKFDDKQIHFGCLMGGNTADFDVTPILNAYEKYGVKSIENKRQAGGHLGLVTDLKLGTPMLRLRFLPSLSFQERVINYTFISSDPEIKKDESNEERVNSTNLDFPLLLQYRTSRYNNFATYVVGGVQYTYDLQSQAKANQSLTDPFIKVKSQDWFAQIGVGVEFLRFILNVVWK